MPSGQIHLFKKKQPLIYKLEDGKYMIDLVESFKKMKALRPDYIIPGHGPVCGIEAIDKQQRYMEKMMEIAKKWQHQDGEAAIPAGELDALVGFYPLYGRPESTMRARVVESIGVAGNPKF